MVNKKQELSPALIFFILSIASIVATLIVLFVTNGEFFTSYLFFDTKDAGMDFFHSIEYVRGRSPYLSQGTLYPPLANLLFYGFLSLIPESVMNHCMSGYNVFWDIRCTQYDLRTRYEPSLIFLIFMIISVVLVILACQYILRKNNIKYASAIATFLGFCYGIIFALNRGNIIIFVLALVLFYSIYNDSENKVLKELALIALALAAGLKLYPAIFGIVLLKNRKWFDTIRLAIYGLAAFFLPFFAFEGGFANNVKAFFSILTGHVESFGESLAGYGIPDLVKQIDSILAALGINIQFGHETVWGLVFLIMLVVCAFFSKKKWETYLILAVAMLAYSNLGVYSYMYIVVPLVWFFATEKDFDKTNILPYICMLLLTLPYPMYYTKRYTALGFRSIVFQLALIVLIVWIIVCTIIRIVKKSKNNKITNTFA